MNKKDFIARVAARAALPEKVVQASLEAGFAELLEQVVQGERISWPGFGSFTRVWHPPRNSRNPRTRRLVQLHPRYSLRFRPGATLQDRLRALVPILQDPEHVRARRTARTMIDDLRLYYQPLIDDALKKGFFSDALLNLLVEIRQRFAERVSPEIASVRNYIEEEIAALFHLAPPPPASAGGDASLLSPKTPLSPKSTQP